MTSSRTRSSRVDNYQVYLVFAGLDMDGDNEGYKDELKVWGNFKYQCDVINSRSQFMGSGLYGYECQIQPDIDDKTTHLIVYKEDNNLAKRQKLQAQAKGIHIVTQDWFNASAENAPKKGRKKDPIQNIWVNPFLYPDKRLNAKSYGSWVSGQPTLFNCQLFYLHSTQLIETKYWTSIIEGKVAGGKVVHGVNVQPNVIIVVPGRGGNLSKPKPEFPEVFQDFGRFAPLTVIMEDWLIAVIKKGEMVEKTNYLIQPNKTTTTTTSPITNVISSDEEEEKEEENEDDTTMSDETPIPEEKELPRMVDDDEEEEDRGRILDFSPRLDDPDPDPPLVFSPIEHVDNDNEDNDDDDDEEMMVGPSKPLQVVLDGDNVYNFTEYEPGHLFYRPKQDPIEHHFHGRVYARPPSAKMEKEKGSGLLLFFQDIKTITTSPIHKEYIHKSSYPTIKSHVTIYSQAVTSERSIFLLNLDKPTCIRLLSGLHYGGGGGAVLKPTIPFSSTIYKPVQVFLSKFFEKFTRELGGQVVGFIDSTLFPGTIGLVGISSSYLGDLKEVTLLNSSSSINETGSMDIGTQILDESYCEGDSHSLPPPFAPSPIPFLE